MYVCFTELVEIKKFIILFNTNQIERLFLSVFFLYLSCLSKIPQAKPIVRQALECG